MRQEITEAAQINLPHPVSPSASEPAPEEFPGWTTPVNPIPPPNSILPPHLPHPSESDGESPGSEDRPSQLV
jgi:hypothetical protein